MSSNEEHLMEKVISLCKRRGFIFPGSEMYGGLAGAYDYGPLGTALKKNIENLWWNFFVSSRDDMYGIDSAILMNPKVWEASGHVATFSDPLVECEKCKRRFRADHLDESGVCPECGGALGTPKSFNLMFKTHAGALEDETSVVYLRPETAQGMFVNFKNIIDSFHPRLPFGIAQIGKAFRNEIAPRDFIFRVRELEIMELEYFVDEKDWNTQFEYWRSRTHAWFGMLGFSGTDIKEVEIPADELAHYSKRTVDFHFKYPHKFDEIGGLAYRTDFDLKNHAAKTGVDVAYLDPVSNEKRIPHVIEPAFGLGRHVLAVLSKAYTEDTLGGETRVYLRLPPHIAPITAAVFPLLKNKPELIRKAQEVYGALKKEVPTIMFDDNGNIGKRYRRQDEIGTPFCITVDFDTLGEKPELADTVTVRDRDSGSQERMSISEAIQKVKKALQ